MKKLVVTFLILVTLTGIAASWLWHDYQRYLSAPLLIENDTVFLVKKGSNYNEILSDVKLISSEINIPYLKFYGRHSKLANKIKAGEYQLSAGITPKKFLEIITSGRSINYQFTIVEGSTFKDLIANISASKTLVDDVSSLTDQELIQQLNVSENYPEGLFLAETYSYEKNSSAMALLKRANRLMAGILNEQWQVRDKSLPYKTPYEALIMASIVEKETARADERPIIAGVFVRRLNKKMRLQTDPTVIYGMGESYKGNIRRSDLRKATPYNTYVIPALPPTPIAMVGREAISAALNPAPGKALYFVAKGDGSHYFSKTLKEHNNAVRRYQLSRRKDYRSSP